MSANKSSTDCVPGALPGGLQRTSFFNGMFLTQSDLEVEQRFWRMKRRLTNRALGQGVVWGLRASFDLNTQKLTLNPGYGLDCCGNDLVVQAPSEVRAPQLIDITDPVIQKLLPNKTGNLVALVLEYAECPEEPRPVHKDACTPSADACASSRVRETARLSIAALPAAVPTPIDNFLTGLDKTKQAARGKLLYEEQKLKKLLLFKSENLHFQVRVRLGNSEVLASASSLQGNQPAQPSASEVFTYPAKSGKTLDAHFELVPDPGYVFHDGAVVPIEGESVGPAPFRLTPPFDVRLAWTTQVLLPSTQADADQGLNVLAFKVTQLGVASLFGGERLTVDDFTLTVNITMSWLPPSADNKAGGQSCHVCIDKIGISPFAAGESKLVTATEAPVLPVGSCLDPLQPGFFLDSLTSPSDAPKTVLLAALYAWLTNSFGSAAGYPQGSPLDPMSFDGQRITGTWLYLTAWKLLFDENPADPDSAANRQALASLLDTLMAQWCAGFFYTGPRCPAEFHGAVLGTATVDQNGYVQSFDMWKGRRWVLTGPLLTHWGAQLGLAPLDVTAGRLVSSICCLGLKKTPGVASPTMALSALPPLNSPVFTEPGGKLDLSALGNGGTLLGDGCYLFYATTKQLTKVLDSSGIFVVATEEVPWSTFLVRLVQSLGTQRQGGAPTTWKMVSVKDAGDAHPILLLETDPHLVGALEKKRVAAQRLVAGLIEDHQEQAAFGNKNKPQAFSLLALPALTDFFTEILFDLPLVVTWNALNAQAFAAADVDAVYAALADADITSCADVVALGIEALVDKVSKTDAEHARLDPIVIYLWDQLTNVGSGGIEAKVSTLWTTLFVGATKGASSWEGANPPKKFRRANLPDTAFTDIVQKALEGWSGLGNLKGPVHCAALRASTLAPTT